MTPFFHALNTGTLAAWLSVMGAGVVGLFVSRGLPAALPPEPVAVAEWATPEIVLDPGVFPSPQENPPALPPEPATDPEELPAPPEMPALAEMEPLPEIPELPEAPPPAAKPTRTEPRPTVAAARPRPSGREPATATATGRSPGGTTAAATGGSGPTDASRLAAGRMPAPDYPPEARRKGQTGTVLVEFTVDGSGRVISAYAKHPSPWPLLNEEAVRTVRRWRFPPGGVIKLQRPIIFQLR